jgi:reactive chlorine resistance protein C
MTFDLSNHSNKTLNMKSSGTGTAIHATHKAGQNISLKISSWIIRYDLPFRVISIGIIVMLLWAGSYKMTVPGADGIVPLVENNPLISWHFKLFGVYHGSDLIGLTEVIAALLIIIGMFKPQAGIIGGAIAAVMFFVTSTMLITTPGALTNVNGINYMSFLGLFLFKDVINLGASLYLMSKFGQKAIIARNDTR